mmetsp:Transcript_13219/g.32988  ORF Transcript_13219/g.32988 Transcript_13219/m.32988 type:complete len:96 (+) Transcript_13219:283-570(+)
MSAVAVASRFLCALKSWPCTRFTRFPTAGPAGSCSDGIAGGLVAVCRKLGCAAWIVLLWAHFAQRKFGFTRQIGGHSSFVSLAVFLGAAEDVATA